MKPHYPDASISDIDNYLYLRINMISYTIFETKENINTDLLRYIAGYVAYRYKNKYNLGTETSKLFDWFNSRLDIFYNTG